PALRRARIVKGHEIGQIVAVERTPVRSTAQHRDDPLRARLLLLRRRRAAVEDATSYLRLRDTRRIVRALDHEIAQVRDVRDAVLRTDLRVRDAVTDRC